MENKIKPRKSLVYKKPSSIVATQPQQGIQSFIVKEDTKKKTMKPVHKAKTMVIDLFAQRLNTPPNSQPLTSTISKKLIPQPLIELEILADHEGILDLNLHTDLKKDAIPKIDVCLTRALLKHWFLKFARVTRSEGEQQLTMKRLETVLPIATMKEDLNSSNPNSEEALQTTARFNAEGLSTILSPCQFNKPNQINIDKVDENSNSFRSLEAVEVKQTQEESPFNMHSTYVGVGVNSQTPVTEHMRASQLAVTEPLCPDTVSQQQHNMSISSQVLQNEQIIEMKLFTLPDRKKLTNSNHHLIMSYDGSEKTSNQNSIQSQTIVELNQNIDTFFTKSVSVCTTTQKHKSSINQPDALVQSSSSIQYLEKLLPRMVQILENQHELALRVYLSKWIDQWSEEQTQLNLVTNDCQQYSPGALKLQVLKEIDKVESKSKALKFSLQTALQKSQKVKVVAQAYYQMRIKYLTNQQNRSQQQQKLNRFGKIFRLKQLRNAFSQLKINAIRTNKIFASLKIVLLKAKSSETIMLHIAKMRCFNIWKGKSKKQTELISESYDLIDEESQMVWCIKDSESEFSQVSTKRPKMCVPDLPLNEKPDFSYK